MDLDPATNEGTAEKEQKPATEYTAQAVSSIVNGEVKLKVGEKAFSAIGLFDATEIPYVSVDSMVFADHDVTVRTEDGDLTFSRMGSWAQPFYDSLYDEYNKAVLRAFFISGGALKAAGDYSFTESGGSIGGKAPIRVYENCIVALPPNSNARRIPLCFVSEMNKKDFELTLKLDADEVYTFSRLGHDTIMFTETVEKHIRAIREKSLQIVKEVDPSVTVAQASQIAKVMPEGAAVQIGKLASISPSFAATVESKIIQTRAANTYAAFKELCDPAQIWIGLKKNDSRSDKKEMPDGEDAKEPDPYLFWMIAPSPDGQYAAVEFAVQPGESAATFVYRTGGDFPRFASRLNRALEAISFKREVIRLTDDELKRPDNADYYMAAKRTASLRFVRTNFAERVIHSSQESWERKLKELWSGESKN